MLINLSYNYDDKQNRRTVHSVSRINAKLSRLLINAQFLGTHPRHTTFLRAINTPSSLIASTLHFMITLALVGKQLKERAHVTETM
jgi:hypothetical protein